MSGISVLDQKQENAHSRLAAQKTFYSSMKWVEKVFEMYYPDWVNRKQIPNSEAIKRDDLEYDSQGSPLTKEQILKSYEKFLATAMSMLEFKDEDVPPAIRDENKADFYRWIDATGITVNDCNPRLKCILRALYEILDGKENKASKDLDNLKPVPNPSAKAYLSTFANLNRQKINESQQAQNLKGKKWNELNYEPKFFGNEQKGKIKLEQIINSISEYEYWKFYFVEQKETYGLVDDDIMLE
ncbi:hypothetical protein C1646_774612 [Rhizophagus diaphanus]|nr:hypothetical protein C1646_774612 [Rhizophagus diaphanus] [Rhizophagus sp. MUCL 43196]